MKIMTDAELLAEIKGFLLRTGMSRTRFGLETMRDGALLSQLEDGRSLSLTNANNVLNWMAAFEREAAA